MTDSIARVPQGIPTGGQFAPTTHAEPEVSLASPVPPRPAETQRARRGHDFYPPAEEMAAWPRLYSTEEIPTPDKPVMAHYFQGSADWWVVEYDAANNEAFGYADLGLGHGEWGYIQLDDVEALRGQFGLPIERDLDFTPGTPAKACIPRYQADAAAAGDREAIEALQDQAVNAILRDVLADNAEPAPVVDEDDRIDYGWDGPDEPSPLSPEGQKLYDEYHRFSYNYGHNVLGVTGFEDRDTIERFAGFAANAYKESGWDGNMDIHGIVDDRMQQERPLG